MDPDHQAGKKRHCFGWGSHKEAHTCQVRSSTCSHDGKLLKLCSSWLLIGWECIKDKDGSIGGVFKTGMWHEKFPGAAEAIIIYNTWKVIGWPHKWASKCFLSDHAAKQTQSFWVSELCYPMPRPVLAVRKNRFERGLSPSPQSCLFCAVPVNGGCQNLTPAWIPHHFLICYFLALSGDKKILVKHC